MSVSSDLINVEPNDGTSGEDAILIDVMMNVEETTNIVQLVHQVKQAS